MYDIKYGNNIQDGTEPFSHLYYSDLQKSTTCIAKFLIFNY